MPEEEPKYTLREARQIINEEYCRYNQHDLFETYLTLGDGTQRVVLIICERCGARFVPEKKD